MPACISNDIVWPLGPIMQEAGFLHLPVTALNSLLTQGHKIGTWFFTPGSYTYFKPVGFCLVTVGI